MIERVCLRDVFGRGADDGCDFDFPIELGRAAWLLHRVIGAAQRGVCLEEEDRFGWNRVAGLLGVIAIIQANGDELRNAGDRRTEPRFAADRGQRCGVEGRQFGQ